MNPPSPVACPIAGRYTFLQTPRSELEKFQTRIRGVTDKPRVQVACRNWVTEFKSCSNTMTRIEVDAEYCESVDYRGRPIGEYGEYTTIYPIESYAIMFCTNYLKCRCRPDTMYIINNTVFLRSNTILPSLMKFSH